MASKSVSCCNHVMSNGSFCGSPALNDDDYCYFHRAARERAKRQARHARAQKPLQLPLLEGCESIQLAIGDVLNALLADRIDTKKAGLLLYGLQTAASNARHIEFGVSEFQTDRTTIYNNEEEETLEQEIAEDAAQEASQGEVVAETSSPSNDVASADTTPVSGLPPKKPAAATAEIPCSSRSARTADLSPRDNP